MNKLSTALKIIREQFLDPVNLTGNLGALLEADDNKQGFLLEVEVVKALAAKTGLYDMSAYLQMRLHNLLLRAREEMEVTSCTK